MESTRRIMYFIIMLVLFNPALCEQEDTDRNEISDEPCLRIHPSTTDIVNQFIDVLPYAFRNVDRADVFINLQSNNDNECAVFSGNSNAAFHCLDRGDSNAAFLAKYRATVHHLSEAGDPLDREAAFYATALTPLIFLQSGRNSWCFLERRALRLYQSLRPTDKRRALLILHNFRTANHRAQAIIKDMPAPAITHWTVISPVKEFLSDEKDLGFIEEIIKHFG